MSGLSSVRALEDFGRVRLSKSFFMRDMLYSEISNVHNVPNIPTNPDLAIQAGERLCQDLLDPLVEQFGRISIRSAYRSSAVNDFGHKNGLGCADNNYNHAKHIWDVRDRDGYFGASANIVVNGFLPYFERTGDWQSLAWWIHDHLPYSNLCFYPTLGTCDVSWHQKPIKEIFSFVEPEGLLMKPGMDHHGGDHSVRYRDMLQVAGRSKAATRLSARPPRFIGGHST